MHGIKEYRKMKFIRGGAQPSASSDPDVNQGLRGRKLTFKLGLYIIIMYSYMMTVTI